MVLSVLLPCCPPIFSSDWWRWGRVSGAGGSKAQMVVLLVESGQGFQSPRGHSASSAFLEVVWCSRKLLCNPRGHSGLLPRRLLTWVCSLRGCSVHLLQGRLPAWAQCWLGPPEVTGSDLLPWRSLTWSCSHGCCWLGPDPAEVLVFRKYSLSFFLL